MKLKQLLLILLFTMISYSQNIPIQWNGEIRSRSEADGRDFQTKTPHNVYSLLRSRFGVSAIPSENLSLFLQLQDSRTFGEEKDAAKRFNTISNTKNLDIHQAYFKVDKFLTDEISFKLGRQEIAYGNERVFSVVGWNNIGRAFDGLVLRYTLPAGFIDALVLNTAETHAVPSPVSAASVKSSQDTGQVTIGGYASSKLSGEVSTDLYAVYQVDANHTKLDTFDLQRLTIGGLAKLKTGLLFSDAEISYQLGSKQGANISAFMIAVSAGYELGGSLLSTISVHADILSGRKAGDKDYKSFELLFSSGHRFYGYLDYFTSFPNQTFDRGIVDAYLRIVSKLSENFSITTVFHNFSLLNGDAVVRTSGNTNVTVKSKSLGQEIDIVSQWKYSKNLLFEIGIGGFLPGEIQRTVYGGSDVGSWGYITTQVNF